MVLAKLMISGHGASGLTWSGVSGEIPPQSLIPESNKNFRYLAFKFGYFFDDAHRAGGDVCAAVALLGHYLPVSGKRAMAALLENAKKKTIRIWAVRAPFERKDCMKARGYRWANGEGGKYKAWWTDVSEDAEEAELEWLREEIYDGRNVELPSETMDAFSRYKYS